MNFKSTSKRISLNLFFFLILSANFSYASDIQECGSDSQPSGLKLRVSGQNINLRLGPGTNYGKIINQKASKILKSTQYAKIDKSVTVIEECTKSGWSKIQVVDPDWLSETHRGWVATKFLKKPKNIKKFGNWYSDWSSEFNSDIAKTLAANKTRGCGEFRFRKNMTDKTDFIVSCTADGKKWVQYRVSTSKNKVEKIK